MSLPSPVDHPNTAALRRGATTLSMVVVLAVVALAGAALWGAGGAAAAAEDQPVGEWPLQPQPEVVQRFDPPAAEWGSGHRGVDLAGHAGQPVRTSLAGTVSFVGSIAGKPVVTVTHGDTRTTYEPVAGGLHKGDVVGAGDVIGHLSLPFSHCFPKACLHWGWLRGDVYLDPLLLVGESGPVRLLPLWRDDPVSEGRAAADPAPPRTPIPLGGWQSPLATWLVTWWRPLVRAVP